MKKKSLKKLELKKQSISKLDQGEISGGDVWSLLGLCKWTNGCTDGCTALQTMLNCTNYYCTWDCGNC